MGVNIGLVKAFSKVCYGVQLVMDTPYPFEGVCTMYTDGKHDYIRLDGEFILRINDTFDGLGHLNKYYNKGDDMGLGIISEGISSIYNLLRRLDIPGGIDEVVVDTVNETVSWR